jgi:hypothetical protein
MNKRDRAIVCTIACRQVTGFSGVLVVKMIDNNGVPADVMVSARKAAMFAYQ